MHLWAAWVSMRKFHSEPAPFIFAFILRGMFERNSASLCATPVEASWSSCNGPFLASFVVAALLLLLSLSGAFPEQEAEDMTAGKRVRPSGA